MSLQIPDYVIDERFITALKRNVISYLSSYFNNNPRNIYQFYLHISSKTDTGMFETLFFAPAKYVMTPLGFAVLYNSVKSVEYLLFLGANPNVAGVVIDCPVEDIKLRWKIDLFRLHEVYPLCLTTPESVVFNRLVEYGLKMGSEYKLRFRLITMEETKERSEICRGVWELAWIFWVKMRDPIMLLKVTDLLLVNGMSATQIMERVNLVPMLKKIFKTPSGNIPNKDEATFIIDLMKILLWSGCSFDETKLVDYIYPCIEIFFIDPQVVFSTQSGVVQRYKTIQGISNLSKIFRKSLRDHNIKSTTLPLLNTNKYYALETFAISAVRKCLTGVLFNKKLAALDIDISFKEIIQTGIPGSQKDQFVPAEPLGMSKKIISQSSERSKDTRKTESQTDPDKVTPNTETSNPQ